VTSGLLLRGFAAGPELAGTAAVVLDVCHERYLDADPLLDARDGLWPDLGLLATSATRRTRRLAELLVTGSVPPEDPDLVPPPRCRIQVRSAGTVDQGSARSRSPARQWAPGGSNPEPAD
jgi:hypothetical protein